jgi:hypothetical protein
MMFFVSVFNSIRKKKFSHFIPIAFFVFALFTPFFYHAMHVFTVPYSRWQIIAVVSMLVYVALNFDERKEIPSGFALVSFFLTLTLSLRLITSFQKSIPNKFENTWASTGFSSIKSSSV